MALLDLLNPNTEQKLIAAMQPLAEAQIAVMNQSANNIAARTYELSPAAKPQKIERDLLRRVRVQGRSKPYMIPLANLLVRKPDQTPEENERAAARLIERRKRAAGYSRSGWAHAVRDMNRVTKRKNPVPSGALRSPATGHAVPAKVKIGGVSVAVIENRVILRGPNSRPAEARRSQAFQRAMKEEGGRWQQRAESQATQSANKLTR